MYETSDATDQAVESILSNIQKHRGVKI